MVIVERGNPLDPAPSALLAEAQALQAATYDEEHNHALPTEALAAPDVRFFVAREGADVLGVGAYKLGAGYGEVKSMFTAPAGRGKGIGAALLRAIEDAAREEGIAALKLETGDELEAACRLYERHGFARCGAFGTYTDNGVSVFYEKEL